MKLTNRQQQFINKLMVLYKESDGPIHYSEVAERLEVSRFTAYDMLRVLEDKGYVTSEFQMPEETAGRSIRVFIPTRKAADLIEVITDDDSNIQWDQIEGKIKTLVDTGIFKDPEIGLEIFARIPPEDSDELHFCIEIISVLLLRARNNPQMKAFEKAYLEQLQPGALPGKTVLSLFTGFALGIMAPDPNSDEVWVEMLIQNIIKFQELLLKFSDDQLMALTNHMQSHFVQAMKILEPGRVINNSIIGEFNVRKSI